MTAPNTPEALPDNASDAVPAIPVGEEEANVYSFKEFYDGIEGECDCEKELKAKVDTATSFTRCVGENPCGAEWFMSFKQMNRKMSLTNWRDKCKYRGVSINKLEGNRDGIKAAYQLMNMISPMAGIIVEGKFVCIFRLNVKAGIVADTPSKWAPGHHTLLKYDGFDIHSLTIEKTVMLEEF